tara:strand:+ start:172 stop:462 length:291 start_codon:yes stop_codon:yes gene_type:complete
MMIKTDKVMTEGMIDDLIVMEGQQFAYNFSATGCALCLNVDVENDTVYYQECYSRYANFTGKNRFGDPRTDKLHHPRPGLKTMTMHEFYGAAIGWV